MSTDSESFIARWSRRKREAERELERPAEAAVPAAPATAPTTDTSEGSVTSNQSASTEGRLGNPVPATEAPLPPIDSLDGVRSDYQAFFQTHVSEDLRRAALKKLFADPHFNQMDMLDVYVDDYTQFEPLPAAMRMRMPSARDFLSDFERAALDAPEATPGAATIADTADACADSAPMSVSAPESEAADQTSAGDAAEAVDANSSPEAPPGKAPPDSTST